MLEIEHQDTGTLCSAVSISRVRRDPPRCGLGPDHQISTQYFTSSEGSLGSRSFVAFLCAYILPEQAAISQSELILYTPQSGYASDVNRNSGHLQVDYKKLGQ